MLLQVNIYSKCDKPDTTNTIFCWAAFAYNKNKTIHNIARSSYNANKYIFAAYD